MKENIGFGPRRSIQMIPTTPTSSLLAVAMSATASAATSALQSVASGGERGKVYLIIVRHEKGHESARVRSLFAIRAMNQIFCHGNLVPH